jgi:hypothetical protein
MPCGLIQAVWLPGKNAHPRAYLETTDLKSSIKGTYICCSEGWAWLMLLNGQVNLLISVI